MEGVQTALQYATGRFAWRQVVNRSLSCNRRWYLHVAEFARYENQRLPAYGLLPALNRGEG
jgi:hypothetical protein